MNAQVKKLWVEALRGKKYKQGGRFLHKKTNGVERYCCLGVLCDLYIQTKPRTTLRWKRSEARHNIFAIGLSRDETSLPTSVRIWAGLKDNSGDAVKIGDTRSTLAEQNDRRMSFYKIADAIEAQL